MSSHCLRASCPKWPSVLTKTAARSRLAFAVWTRLSATSMLNKERIPSRRLFMIAALAASSVVGGSRTGDDDLGIVDALAVKGFGLGVLVGFGEAADGGSSYRH